MKKDLLISLGVMVLLTIIVGFTAYNLSSRWTDLPDVITRNVAKEMLLVEIATTIDKQIRVVDLYVLNPSESLNNELEELHNNVMDHIKSLQIISGKTTSEKQRISLISTFYTYDIYNQIKKIVTAKDAGASKDELSKEMKELDILNLNVIEHINAEKRFTVPIYTENINELRNYSRNVTFIITIVCVLLGIILMAISVNHISSLYEKIEKQAIQLETNLDEIKQINKELITTNELNVKIQEAERLRIAQDLHDEVIQGLISLIRITGDTSDNVNMSYLNNQLNSMIVQIRKICQNLRPSILDDLGLYSAIEWLMDDLEKYGIVPHLEIDEQNMFEIHKKTELMIFRVVQELTNNIKKHSKASNAWLNMKFDQELNLIKISMKDDGCGFDCKDKNFSKTLGIVGIKERIKSVSGEFNIYSEINNGTNVDIYIPVKNNIDIEDNEENK